MINYPNTDSSFSFRRAVRLQRLITAINEKLENYPFHCNLDLNYCGFKDRLLSARQKLHKEIYHIIDINDHLDHLKSRINIKQH